jgi:ankyrin repeat protein
MRAAAQENIGLDSRDEEDLTAFELALHEPGEDDYIIQAFLDCGFSFPQSTLENAILSCRANELNASKVELALSKGVKVDTIDPEGFTALHWCALLGAVKAGRLIINHPQGRGLIHARDEDGRTPLHCAVESKSLAMTKLLIEEGAKIDEADSDGKTPLADAIIQGNAKSVTYLLRLGAEIFIRQGDITGGTVLHYAVSKNPRHPTSMLAYLLTADLEREDPRRFPNLHDPAILDAVSQSSGDTAFHVAAHFGDYTGLVSLNLAGASPQIRNAQALMALDVALARLEFLDSKPESAETYLRGSLVRCIEFLKQLA